MGDILLYIPLSIYYLSRCNGLLPTHEKEGDPTICNSMDVAKGHYA